MKTPDANDRKPRKPTLADILRNCGDRLTGLGSEQQKVIRDLTLCRTEALGGQLYACSECGHLEPRYHSCRNRHCPQCQSLARDAWVEARKQDLLPGNYFHVVFTLPHLFNDLLLRNRKIGYGLFFKAVSRTLLQVGKRRLGGQIGVIAMLHTWEQQLRHHPHIHCLIPGGALKTEPDAWIASRPDYLFPVEVLSEVFRGKFLPMLEHAFAKGRFVFPGKIAPLEKAGAFVALLKKSATSNWVVFAKPTFKDPVPLLDYLGRYTHRIAIANHRIEAFQNGQVTFTWLDRSKEEPVRRRATLDAEAFARRFLQHTLPKNFYRIRYYGFLSSGIRKNRLHEIRTALFLEQAKEQEKVSWRERLKLLTGTDVQACPRCGTGRLKPICELPKRVDLAARSASATTHRAPRRLSITDREGERGASSHANRIPSRQQLLLFD